MATIKQLKDHDTNENIYPLTHINAVRDSNNNTVLELLDEKQDELTFDTTPTSGSSNPVTSGGVYNALSTKLNNLTFDLTPTANSDNPVVSKGIKSALDTKVDKVTSTDNAIVRFDGTTGDVQNSSATVDDNGTISVKDVIIHGSNNTNDTRIISSDAANGILVKIGAACPVYISNADVRPGSDMAGVANLGSPTRYWNNVYAKKYIVQNGTASQFLKADGSVDSNVYATTSSVNTALNNYVNKITSTDNAVTRFDGTDGQIQNSGVTIDDSNNISTSGKITTTDDISVKNVIVHGSINTNDRRIIASDSDSNMYISINGSIPAVFSYMNSIPAIRPSISNKGIANLGATDAWWNNVYANKYIVKGGTTYQFLKADGTLAGNWHQVTNPFGGSGDAIQQNIINNGFYAGDQRFDVTLTGFNNNNLKSRLFDSNFEYTCDIAAGGTGTILLEGKNDTSLLGSYNYGWTYVSFYYSSIPESVSMRVYSKGGGSTDYAWHSLTMSEYLNASTQYCVRFYNASYYQAKKFEITIVAKSDKAAKVSQLEHQFSRGNLSQMSVVTKYALQQDLYGDVTAPKFIKRGGTSTQFLKADGSVDSNSYALASSIPAVNDATLTIQQDGVTKGTFTANASNNTTVNIDLSGKQDSLNSGLNIKTINGTSLLGSGNIDTNSPFVVTFTENNDTITCDTSIYSICDAHVAGKAVIGRDLAGCEYLLSVSLLHQLVVFTSTINASGLYRLISGLGGGSEGTEGDGWVAGSYTTILQQLVSGNNIKTVNSSSILGSGDLVLAGSDLNYTGSADSIVTPNSSINEAIEDLDTALHELGTPNEIASITAAESLMSGGNNVITITDTDGNSTSFNVKNGLDGHDGADGISLGEIGLVQNTGYNADKVMSLLAVTKNISRLNEEDLSSIENLTTESASIPDSYLQLSYIDNGAAGSCARIDTGLLPDDTNWRFVGSWARTGTPTSSYSSIIIAYTSESSNCYRIGREATDDRRLRCVAGNLTTASTVFWLSDTNINVWHTYDLQYSLVIVDGVSHAIPTTQGTTLTSNLYIGHINYPQKIGEFKAYYNDTLVAHLIPCKAPDGTIGMYDVVRRQFFSSDNENDFIAGDIIIGASDKLLNGNGLASLISQETGNSNIKLMSQKAITDNIQLGVYTYKLPKYLQGRLCYFKFSDYPQLDVRSADGISVVFNSNYLGYLGRDIVFSIIDPTINNTGMSSKHFSLMVADGNISFGFFNSYFSKINDLCSSTTFYKGGYLALTFDFKTGTRKIYVNGKLILTQTPANWDELTMLRDYFDSCTHLLMSSLAHSSYGKSSGFAIFGRVLTDGDVSTLYRGGKESILHSLIPSNWGAKQLHPIYTTASVYIFNQYATKVVTETGTDIILKGTNETNVQQFGFDNLDGLFLNNCIFEFDMEVTSGRIKYVGGNYDRKWRGNATGVNYATGVYTIVDENNNDVTLSDLEIGSYHVTAKPNFIATGGIFNANSSAMNTFVFSGCSSDCIIHINSTLKITEIGTALECSISTYRGSFWELPNGIKLPLSNTYIYGTGASYIGTDTFIEETVLYKSSIKPEFNGQIAIDAENAKIYIGYLTGTGGIWKQVNNS